MTIAGKASDKQKHQFGELYSETKIEPLNEALTTNDLSSQDVVSIFYEPAEQLIKPSPERLAFSVTLDQTQRTEPLIF